MWAQGPGAAPPATSPYWPQPSNTRNMGIIYMSTGEAEMPTLRDLDGQFIRYREETKEGMFARGVAKPAFFLEHVPILAEAHGVRFLCPKSFAAHGGKVGAHSVQVYFAGSPVP